MDLGGLEVKDGEFVFQFSFFRIGFRFFICIYMLLTILCCSYFFEFDLRFAKINKQTNKTIDALAASESINCLSSTQQSICL